MDERCKVVVGMLSSRESCRNDFHDKVGPLEDSAGNVIYQNVF